MLKVLVGVNVTSTILAAETSVTKSFVVPEKEGAEKLVVWIQSSDNSVSTGETYVLRNLQIEIGDTATDYDPYTEPVTYTPDAEGSVSGVTSLAPTMTLLADKEGTIIDCTYNRDANKVYEELVNAIISLGGNI